MGTLIETTFKLIIILHESYTQSQTSNLNRPRCICFANKTSKNVTLNNEVENGQLDTQLYHITVNIL